MLSAALRMVLVCSARCNADGLHRSRNIDASRDSGRGRHRHDATGRAAAISANCPAAFRRPASPKLRARVSGIVIERTFQQGGDVKAGDVLYRIDPAPFEVELQASEAALAQGAGRARAGEPQAKRIETLIAGQVAIAGAAGDARSPIFARREADVAARKADVQRSRLNLEYATVRSPISGRIGRALVTEGALVGQGEATHWRPSSISTRSMPTSRSRSAKSTSFAACSKAAISKPSRPRPPRCGWCSTTATIYPHAGRLLFSDATVDPTTGQVTLRGDVPESARTSCCPACMSACRSSRASTAMRSRCRSRRSSATMPARAKSIVVRDDNRAIVQPVRPAASSTTTGWSRRA